MPPESGSTRSLGAVGELDELEQLVARLPRLAVREVEVAAVDEEVLPHGQLRVERVLLGHDAEAGADPRAVAVRVHAEHAQLPPLTRRHAADHAHRRGLAGAVRAQEAERLAPARRRSRSRRRR